MRPAVLIFRFFRRRSCCFGLTMSEEGGVEELEEFFFSVVISASSSAIFSRAAWSSFSSFSIRLSLASIMVRILFFPT